MNEKLLSEILGEIKGIKNEITGMKDRLIGVEKTVIRIEQNYGEKISALFDSREVQADVNEKILSTLCRIEAKMDALQMETAHIRKI